MTQNCPTPSPDVAVLQNPLAMRYLRGIWIFMPGAAELEFIITAFAPVLRKEQLYTYLTFSAYRHTAAHMITLLAAIWTQIDQDNISGFPDRHLSACQDGLANFQAALGRKDEADRLTVNLDHVRTWFGEEIAAAVQTILLDTQKKLQAK